MASDVVLGQLLRERRLKYGWSVETVGIVYGNKVRGKPVTGGAIHTMEEGKIPNNQTRRWVLARIFNIAPVAFGLTVPKGMTVRIPSASFRKAKPVDIPEYHNVLLSYWKVGYSGTAENALKDLGARINLLHENVLYVNSAQKEMMKRLLCGFHMRRADVAHELSYHTSALEHLNKAVILAREESFIDLEATALYRRGEYYFDNWNFNAALKDFKAAQSLDRPTIQGQHTIPSQVKGRVLNVRGLTEARLAQNETDMKAALKWIDKSERFSAPTAEDDIHMLDLTMPMYLTNRAKALVSPQNKKLHLSDEAYLVNDEMIKHSTLQPKRFQAYHSIDSNIIQALYHMDKKHYPVATVLAQTSLTMMQDINSTLHLPVVIRIYESLLESTYGTSIEVAELGLSLLFVQFPQLFR